jgi:hypothetical protein
MRFIAILLSIVLLPSVALAQNDTASPAPATAASGDDAFDSPLKSPQSRQQLRAIGRYYKRFAKDLGCDTFAWGTISFDDTQFVLKYLPSGDKMADWTRMTFITVHGLTGDKKKDGALIIKTISDIEGEYIKSGKVSSDENYLSPDNEHTMFLEYQMGPIHGASVFMRTGKASAALIQLQTRGTAMAHEDALKVQRLVNPQAEMPNAAPDQKVPVPPVPAAAAQPETK